MIRLLAERVAACWLQVHHAEYAAAASLGGPMKQAAFAQSRLESAERRYTRAIGTVLTARRLLQPAERSVVPVEVPKFLPDQDDQSGRRIVSIRDETEDLNEPGHEQSATILDGAGAGNPRGREMVARPPRGRRLTGS